jgi:bud emergence protein 1
VTYDELYEKVHARLGAAVSALRYKDASMGGGGGYGEIRDDQELRDWMRAEDQKLVLYAER